MARWLLDEETGEYINADDLDPSQYEVVTPWGKIEDDVSQPREQVAPQPTPPEEEQSPYALLGIAPKALGTVERGLASLGNAYNDASQYGVNKLLDAMEWAGIKPADQEGRQQFNDLIYGTASKQNKKIIDQANERDRAVLDYYNVPPDSGTATAINIGGAAIPTIGMTALGAMYGLPAGLLATAPAVLPSAEKYQNLQDQGVDKSTAAGTAIANFAFQSGLNRADIMPLLSKDMSTLWKALGYSATNTAANEIGTIGEAALDSRIADRPWTNDQLSSAMTAAGITGAVSGPLVAPFTRARPEAAADMGPGMSSVDEMFQRMSAEGNDWEMTSPAPTAPQSLMIEGDARLGLPAPRPPLVPDGPEQLPAPPTRGALPAPETPQGLPLPEWMDPNAIQQPFTGEVPKQLPLPEWWDTLPKGDLTLDSDIPLFTPAQPEVDSLSQITPAQTKTPLIADPNVIGPGRTPEQQAQATQVQQEIALQRQAAEDAQLRKLEDIFMPEDSKVGAFRQSTPDTSNRPQLLKNASWRGQLVKDLSPEERNIAGQIISASKGQKIPTTADVNPQQGEPTVQTQVINSDAESFPQPVASQAAKIAEGAKPKQPAPATEPQVSAVEPVSPRTLPAAEDDVPTVRKKESQRVANRYKRPVTSKESGRTSFFTDLAYLVAKPFMKEELPGGPIPKGTLDKGGLLRKVPGWGRHAEWMKTTVRKNPEAAPYVDAGYKIGQDANTMMWDASETLQPFLEMDDSRAAPVQAYLYAKRYAANGKELKGARQANATPVSIDDAMRYGLDKEQAQAALAVSNWSKTWLETLKHDALEDLKFEMQQTLSDPKVKSAPDKIKAIQDGYSKSVQQITERFNQMQQQNYVPLSRYGKYFVNLKDAQGNVIESLRFEKPSHPNYAKTIKHFDRLAKEQGGSLERGVDPDRLEFTTKDMPKDILELMGQEGSLSGFPGHLKPARLVPGFEWDLKRAVADYSTKGARFIAMRRAKRAWAQERATLLANPLNNSLVNKLESWSNNFDKVDGAFFNGINEAFNVAYIGGNLRTPTADIIGRMHLQYPLIQKYADPKMFGISGDVIWTKAIGKEFDWYLTKDATKKFDGKYDGLGSGIEEAQKKGIIQSRVQKHLLEMASGKDKGALGAVNNARKFYFGVKEMTERSNNLSSFIIGWDLYPQWAKRQPDGAQVPTRQAFAENFVREANPVPGMAELPPVFGKRTVRLVTKYKTYQGKLIKTLAENPNMRVWSRYLAAMMGTTGLMGLPFMRDTISAARGSGVEPEEAIREAGFGAGTLYGPLSAATGIDFSGTAGFGEVLPGVNQGGLTKAMLGVLGAPIASVERASDLFSRDQTLKGIAALPFVPNPIANALNVTDWATYGARTKGGDVLIQRDDVTGTDMLKKLLGYQPMSLKEAYAKYNIKSGELARSRDNDNINQRIGQAKAIDDYATVNTLREEARSKGIKINDKQVKKYEMAIREGQSLLEANAPKKMKQRLKEIDRLFD